MPSRRTVLALAGCAALCALAGCGERAAAPPTVRVAVAANFITALERIGGRFTAATGIEVAASAASTGKLFAQIHNGAPFDVFLAADAERPAKLVADGLAVADTAFTYAVGRLALCGAGAADGVATLRAGAFTHLAIANPDTAPYGRAAVEVLEALGLRERLRPMLAIGENIGQAMQFVDSGAAEVGLVALAQVVDRDPAATWTVPATLHAPIRQDAVLLTAARDRAAATAFLAFLRSEPAREVLRELGYEPGEQ